MHCDVMQGFWFSRPVSGEVLMTRLGDTFGGELS
jgi:EAL domain-containing protein (putative c-di-GMP-specific phosphodiesterase class I)